jgi:hypothetical protein
LAQGACVALPNQRVRANALHLFVRGTAAQEHYSAGSFRHRARRAGAAKAQGSGKLTRKALISRSTSASFDRGRNRGQANSGTSDFFCGEGGRYSALWHSPGWSGGGRYDLIGPLSRTSSQVSRDCPKLLEVGLFDPSTADIAKSFNKKPSEVFPRVSNWVQGLDLNQRPSGYE